MTRFSRLAVVLFLGAWIASGDNKLTDEHKELLSKYVRTTKIESARKYLKQLVEAGCPKEIIQKAAKRRLAPVQEKMDRACRDLASPFKRISDEKYAKNFVKSLDAWLKSATEAMNFMFDNSKYAVPEKAKTGWIPGVDIQTNQAIVEGLVEETIEQWNPLEREFARLLGYTAHGSRSAGGAGFAKKLKHERDPLKNMAKLRVPILQYKLADPSHGFGRFVEKVARNHKRFHSQLAAYKEEAALAIAGGVELPKLKIPGLALTVTAIFAGDYAAAAKFKPSPDSLSGKMYAMLVQRYLLMKSLEFPPRSGWTNYEKQVLHVNNLYRMSLGLHPMLANEKLYSCAKKHSTYQKKHGMTHTEIYKETKTPSLRAKKEGYRGGITENCSGVPGIATFWAWRCDAGHHRNLIRPKSKVVGIAAVGPITQNTGTTCEDPKLALLFKVVLPRPAVQSRFVANAKK